MNKSDNIAKDAIVQFDESSVVVDESKVDSESIKSTIVSSFESSIFEGCAQEDAFVIVDLSVVRSQYHRWVSHLPRVKPFYAVKCNSDPVVVKELVNLGIGFDCASRPEIDLVLSMGVSPNDVIYANPCKQPSHLSHASKKNIAWTTVDNADELYKIAKYAPNIGIVFRLLPDDSSAICRLSNKFGANMDDMYDLLVLAKELNLNVVGTSFHCGSGCRDPYAYADAVKRARKVFDLAKQVGLPPLTLLDIGGGFPGAINNSTIPAGKISFEQIVNAVKPAIDLYFPEESGVTIIAEPGRYFVDASMTIFASVIARRAIYNSSSDESSDTESDDFEGNASKRVKHTNGKTPSGYMIYINDGLYQSFNCIVYDHASVSPHSLRPVKESEKLIPCSVYGPTCDGLDKLADGVMLPEMNVGDWVYFPNSGAYTFAAASNFNGFNPPERVYINQTQ